MGHSKVQTSVQQKLGINYAGFYIVLAILICNNLVQIWEEDYKYFPAIRSGMLIWSRIPGREKEALQERNEWIYVTCVYVWVCCAQLLHHTRLQGQIIYLHIYSHMESTWFEMLGQNKIQDV